MANQLYPKAKEALLDATLDLNDANIKAALTRSAYSAAHTFVTDITLVQSSSNLTTKSITSGVFTSDNVTFNSVGAGAAIPYIVLYEDTGTPGTSKLIAHIDTGTGLPVTPDGTNITVNRHASGWFTL